MKEVAVTPEQTIEKLMFGFIGSQTLFVCHRLKVFDHLEDHGPSTCRAIAVTAGLPEDSLERLLISAVCHGLLEKEGPCYRLHAPFAPYLAAKGAKYLGGKFSHYSNASYPLFAYLEDAVRENRQQWNKVSGDKEVTSIYADFVYAESVATREFLETMWASGYTDSLELCAKNSFAGFTKLVDLGGATGSFAIAALQKNPELTAVVMDLPPVEPYATQAFVDNGCQHRAGFHRGDMFEDALPEGDIYVIGYVLSDWPEERCTALIKKAYDALPPGGLIVVLEKFFNKDKTGPFLTGMLNLTMLLEMEGQHRSVDEYAVWLDSAGFSDMRAVYSSGEKHMLVGRKT